VNNLHAWNLTPTDAIVLQRELAARVDFQTPLDLTTVQIVAGVDVSVRDDISTAALVALSFPGLQVLDRVTARQPTSFPYIPGLLSFREIPVLLEAHARLSVTPDAYLVDGMGRIHPRRIGIASHLGLWLDAPTVGVGKTHFIGTYDASPDERGAFSPLTDKGELLGVVLRTKHKVKPLYISPGHRIDLDSAIALVLACTTTYRLPEPIRAAHNTAGTREAGDGEPSQPPLL
jgi:deoxyribonuclease V